MGFHVFTSSSVVVCSVPVFASITIISDSSLFHCLRYETFEHNKFELPTAILSRRDIIQEMHVPNKALSSLKYFLFKTSKHNVFFVSLLGMACQVSGAVVAAVSAMTVELGRRLAPVIVEKGGKVSFS